MTTAIRVPIHRPRDGRVARCRPCAVFAATPCRSDNLRPMLPSLAFFVAALILAVTPGPGIAYVVARTAAGGRGEGLASCVGTGLGGMLHVGAAALGLSVLLAQSA